METAISTIKTLPETKSQIAIFAAQLEKSLNNGEIVATDLMRFEKAMAKVFKAIKPTLTECTLTELSKYEKSPIIKGSEFTIVEAGVQYDYSGCGDPEYSAILLELANIKLKQESRETFLKSLKEPLQIVDKNGGEVHTVCPPIKTSSTTVKVTFK